MVCVYHGVKGPVYGANRASSACTAVCTPTRPWVLRLHVHSCRSMIVSE